MQNNITYIPMEPAMQLALKERYTGPFRKNVSFLVIALLVTYCLVIFSLLTLKDVASIPHTTPIIVITAVFLLIFWMAYPKFKKMNIHYLDDANFGQIVREQTAVTKVFDTPAGINIYWLQSAAVKTFTPEPYRSFAVGDVVTIYYLKYSQDYLAYEV